MHKNVTFPIGNIVLLDRIQKDGLQALTDNTLNRNSNKNYRYNLLKD